MILFRHSDLNIWHRFLVLFVINLSEIALLYLTKVLIAPIPWVKACNIHFACSILLSKLHDNKASQIDIFTNKLDNLGNTTIPWVFFTHFNFESVLWSNTHGWWATLTYIKKTYLKHYQFSLQLLFLCCMMNVLKQITTFITELLNRLPHFATQSIDWYLWWVGWIHFLFSSLISRENCLLAFLFIRAWLSLDTSGETTSWITFVWVLAC